MEVICTKASQLTNNNCNLLYEHIDSLPREPKHDVF